jgi:hypothetical protein
VLTRFRAVSKLMEYNAGVMHKFSASESHITIPSNLLKTKDLSDTYRSLSKMKELLEGLKTGSGEVREEQTQAFSVQKEQIETFQWITLL